MKAETLPSVTSYLSSAGARPAWAGFWCYFGGGFPGHCFPMRGLMRENTLHHFRRVFEEWTTIRLEETKHALCGLTLEQPRTTVKVKCALKPTLP